MRSRTLALALGAALPKSQKLSIRDEPWQPWPPLAADEDSVGE